MRILEVLKEDHVKFANQLGELISLAKAGEGARVREVFMAFCTGFEQHSQAEENLFYPVIQGHRDEGDLVQRARAQHENILQMINKLRPLVEGDPTVLADRFSQLKSRVREHTTMEESEIFKIAQKAIPASEMKKLGSRVAKAEPELHP